MPLTAGLMAGILVGLILPGGFGWALVTFFCIGAYIAWCAWRRRPLLVMPLLFFAVAGYLAIQPWVGREFPAGHVRHFVDDGRWQVLGRIVTAPQVRQDRWRFVLEAQRLYQTERSVTVTGRIQVTARTPLPELQRGDTVTLVGYLREIRNFCNPGGFDYERYMALQGIHCRIYARKGSIRIVSSDSGLWARHLDDCRGWLGKRIDGALRDHPDAVAAVIRALALGDRTGISPELRTAFNRAGVSHVLAISGLHIGMVAAAAFLLFQWILVRVPLMARNAWVFRAAAALSALPVLGYGLLSGFSPSTQRAAIMAAFFLAGFWVGRPYNWPNVLCLAALTILVCMPPALSSISFQLSFAAVWVILLGFKRLPWLTPRQDQPLWRCWRLRTAALAWISLLAALGTLPLVMFYFNLVSWVGPLSNLCVVPLVGTAVVPAALAGVLCASVSTTAATVLWQIAAWGVRAILWLVETIAAFEAAAWRAVTPTMIEIVLFYLFLAVLFFWKKIPFRSVVLLLLLLAASADAIYWHHRRFGRETLSVTAIDVGQGGSNLLQLPGGYTVLVDGGGFGDAAALDVGRSIVAPLLWHHRIQRVDLVILSHPDSDHLNGLIYILRHFEVGEIWSNHEPAATESFRQWQAIIAQKGLKHVAFERLPRETVRAGVRFQILAPPAEFAAQREAGRRSNANHNSLVVRVVWGDHAFLFTGDIEKEAEVELLTRLDAEQVRSTVLMVPHHGSRDASSADFVRAVGPHEAIVSAGWRNPFRFPHREVVERYRRSGCRLWRTDHCGAVQVSTDGRSYDIRTCRAGCP